MSKRNDSEETAYKFEADQEYIRSVEQLYESTAETCNLYIKIINTQERELQQQKEIIAHMEAAQAKKELQMERYQKTLDRITEELTKPNESWIIELKATFLRFWQHILPKTSEDSGKRR